MISTDTHTHTHTHSYTHTHVLTYMYTSQGVRAFVGTTVWRDLSFASQTLHLRHLTIYFTFCLELSCLLLTQSITSGDTIGQWCTTFFGHVPLIDLLNPLGGQTGVRT